MLKTLRISFTLKITYTVNAILYAIKGMPILKRVIPPTVYKMEVFKAIAMIFALIWELFKAFFGKLLYFFVMIFGAVSFYGLPEENEAALFLHIILFLTVVGAFMNTYMFNPTQDKYYAMILLGMNAKEYTLINYAYEILKVFSGFTLFGLIFGLLLGVPFWQCLLVPFFAVGSKVTVAAYELIKYERRGHTRNENKGGKFTWIIVLLCLALAYGAPAIGFIVPRTVSTAVMCIPIISGLFSVRKLLTFTHYRAMQKELLSEITSQMDESAEANLLKEQRRGNISTNTGITSDKKGFNYLNDLFIKRHRKILWRPAVTVAAVAAAVLAAALIAIAVIPSAREGVNEMIMSSLPVFVFIMYAINRGTGFSQALFINCDHSLLTYSFYKRPRFILKLFRIRLYEIIKINLLPAAVIGVGLSLLLLASGGTDNPLNYAVVLVSILSLSVFFSVHYLTLYYLLQPYNAGTELKSGTYKFIMSVTYFICYMLIQFEVPTLIFGILTTVFCLLYSIIASILVYKLAPVTFKIRA